MTEAAIDARVDPAHDLFMTKSPASAPRLRGIALGVVLIAVGLSAGIARIVANDPSANSLFLITLALPMLGAYVISRANVKRTTRA